MSITHCLIRVEIADESELPVKLNFSSQFRMAEAVDDPPPEKSDKRRPLSPPVTTPVSADDVVRFHGKREPQDITVETYSRNIPDAVGEKPQSVSQPSMDSKHARSRRKGSRSSSESDMTSPIPGSDDSSVHVTFGDFQPSEKLTAELSEDSEKEGGDRRTVDEGDEELLSDGSKEQSTDQRSEMSPIPAREIPFISGNPSVEVTKGILHLFKENHSSVVDDDLPRSEMLCMLAVPASMTCHSLLQFLAPCGEGIQYIRIIRNSTPNEFMVLLKFGDQRAADEVYKEFNNQPFNSFEKSCCHLIYVSQVECMKSNEGGFLPLPYHTELPTCHICLERMDESVDGILTILCNHTFHGSCLTKWGDTSCPICRHSQTPEQVENNSCFQCGSQESLWICLICGHVGCGRYVETHAFRHFEETQHTYAMQLGNHRVWDYAGDNYVHRLVQNKADGKPVEMNNSTSVERDEKMDSITLEFNYLLSSQLDSQRKYFEEKIARVEEDALLRVSEEETRSKKTLEERDRVEQRLQSLAKDKITLERKLGQINSKLKKAAAELKEEREMNKCLRGNQKPWQDKVDNLEKSFQEMQRVKEKEIIDLKEQLRDVMFYLEAQNTINQTPDDTRQEIQEGQIVMGAAGNETPPGRSGGRKGRKKGK